jgi:predicted metalloprotease
LVIGAIAYYFMGGNPLVFIAQNMGGSAPQTESQKAVDTDRKKFASVVLADTEDVWDAEFKKSSKTYRAPKLVLFRGRVESACGRASAASGPFYCPSDERVYLDTSFFDELSQTLGAKGDFAGAYVIAHEIGHHVQTVLGLKKMRETERPDNQESVAIELQADCLAGVWAKQTEAAKNVIEPGDIDEAMKAASAVGDDRLQKMSRGEVVPDSFTHGSSAQRTAAFQKGYSGGALGSCTGDSVAAQ